MVQGPSNNERGHISELKFESALISRGWIVSKAPSYAAYDYVVDDQKGNIHRVQVKTLRERESGNFELKLRPSGGKYTKKNCDFIVGVFPNGNLVWMPVSRVRGRNSMTVPA